MPEITRLEPDRRRPWWIDFHLDGVFYCRLKREDAESWGWTVGTELSPVEIDQLETAQRREALHRALRYLSVRPRSCHELERHLKSRAHSEAAIDGAICECDRLGYVDDEAFAAAYARDRIRLRPRSPTLLKAELRSRGVRAADADAGIASALEDEGVDLAALLERAARNGAKRLRGQDRTVARSRLAGYLSRRGFSVADVRAALDTYLPPDR